MILGEKITRLRKKIGWSQEDLAEKMNVSRQAVSKWESGQTIPDLDKILLLSNLFNVTTDYLLKDKIEDEEYINNEETISIKCITMIEANAYLLWRKKASIYIAIATFLCIISIIPLLILSAISESKPSLISESIASGIGLTIMFIIIAFAVTIFIYLGFKNAPFDYIDKEPFKTEYGITNMIKEEQKKYRSSYIRNNIIGAITCILSPIPLFIGIILNQDLIQVIMVTLTLLIVGIGTFFFITTNIKWTSMQKLLKEGDYTPKNKRKAHIQGTITTIYWLSATAIYLTWSFLTNDWEITWIVFLVAGVLFAALMSLCNIFLDKEME